MRFKLSLSQKALILVVIPLAFELGFVFELQSLLHEVERENAREVHAREVATHLSNLLRFVMSNSLNSAITSFSKSMSAPTEMLLVDPKKARDKVHAEIEILKKLTSGHPREEASFRKVSGLLVEMVDSWGQLKGTMDDESGLGSLKVLLRARQLENKILASLDAFIDDQLSLERSEVVSQRNQRDRIEHFLMLGVAFNVILALFLALYFNRGTTRRLNVLLENTVRLGAGEKLRERVDGDDEIAQIDRTFHEMAASLAQAARKDRAIVDKAMDVICSIDERGSLIRISPAAEKLWGYNPDDLVGRKYLTLISPQDHASTLAAMQEIKEGKSDVPVENRVVCRDGSLMYMLWSARWSQEDKMMFCVAHDITARKQSERVLRDAEARVRSIVESVPVGLLIIDAHGLVEFVNPSCVALCGVSAPELVGMNIAQLFGNKNAAKFLLDLMRETTGGAWHTQLKPVAERSIPVEVSSTKFAGAGGERFLIMLVDMTERNEIERMRQEFLSMVSHDLRSPLTSVQSFLDLLGSGLLGNLNEKGEKKLAAADRNVAHLITMIKDLLDVERAKAGKLLIFPEEITLRRLVEQAVDAVRNQAENQSIALVTDISDMTLVVDGDRLAQVLINLLTNALKFSPDLSTIYVTSRVLNDWVELRVTDQGRGIAADHQKQIFERFQQVKPSDAGYQGGTGLGLAICKAIVDQHGGTIGVDSKEHQGSSFWFRVPQRVRSNA